MILVLFKYSPTRTFASEAAIYGLVCTPSVSQMMNEMPARAIDTIAAPRILSANSALKKRKVTAETTIKIADKIKKILRIMLSSFVGATPCVARLQIQLSAHALAHGQPNDGIFSLHPRMSAHLPIQRLQLHLNNVHCIRQILTDGDIERRPAELPDLALALSTQFFNHALEFLYP